MIDDLIVRLDQWFRINQPENYQHLQSGLNQEELNYFEKQLGVTLPGDFKAFYHWKNGQDAGFSCQFAYRFNFMPAKSVIRSFKMLNGLQEGGDFEKANWWSPNWIPFMENWTGDHYCLDLGGSFGGIPGQIIEFWHDWESRTIQHPSFRNWLELLVTALEKGGLVLHKERLYWEETDDYDALYQQISPGYPIEQEAG